VITRAGSFALTSHLSALRLAPKNLAVTAGMVGAGLDLHVGGVAAEPFIELGAARVAGRFDAGGYYVAPRNEYIPFWSERKQDGIGVGAGVDFHATVAPHILIEAMVGHWSFNVPTNLPRLPTLFMGAGLRVGL
jgi:hypothetical protein